VTVAAITPAKSVPTDSIRILPVFILLENHLLFDSSDEDMVQHAGCLPEADKPARGRQASMQA